VEALRQGDNVHAILELDKCKLATAVTPPDMTGAMTRMNFDVFSYYKVVMPNGKLQFAVATSSNLLVEHRQFGVAQGYARLRVFEDDSAELHLAHFDPKTYEQKSDINYLCQLNNGMRVYDDSDRS